MSEPDAVVEVYLSMSELYPHEFVTTDETDADEMRLARELGRRVIRMPKADYDSYRKASDAYFAWQQRLERLRLGVTGFPVTPEQDAAWREMVALGEEIQGGDG